MRAVHLLSLLDQRTGCVLSQSRVDAKTNKHKGALELLKTLVLKGRVITGDAMFCQRDLCQKIRDHDGHYFFVVKDNQSTLKESSRRVQGGPMSSNTGPRQTNGKVNCILMLRKRSASHAVESNDAVYSDWPELTQVCRLVRTTWRNGTETTEIDYAITSVPRNQADAAQLLAWCRGHWGSETARTTFAMSRLAKMPAKSARATPRRI